MNNILNEVEELKELVLNSKEYKNYEKYLKQVEDSKEINELVNKITNLQKEIVRLEQKKEKTIIKEKQLEELYLELNSYELYNNYINSSKELNSLITNIQKEFQDFFDSLVS